MNTTTETKATKRKRLTALILTALAVTLAISLVRYTLDRYPPASAAPTASSDADGSTDILNKFWSLLLENGPHADNVFVNSRDKGGCRTLAGDITVTVVFVDDPTATWTADAIEAEKQELAAAAQTLLEQAAAYGQTADISFVYESGTASQTPSLRGDDAFAKSALESAGLPKAKKLNSTLRRRYGCDQAPVVLCVNHGGRSYAHCNDNGEYAVLYQQQDNPFAHEFLHLFGAEDFYYPTSVKSLAESLFGESIMLNAATTQVDELTAYLVGWADTPGTAGEQFLTQTDYLTPQMMQEEYDKTTYTGTVTDYYDGTGTYSGDLVDGVQHGIGTYTWPSGDSYSGSWQNGRQHGLGTYTWQSGNVYVGNWDKGDRHGFGTITWSDGSNYAGNWVHDIREGQGTFTWADGDVYEGSWVNNEMHGKGTITWTNGTRYVGDWVEGQRQGYGVITWASGSRHEGEWVNGLRHGKGTYYRADGTVGRQGIWKNDEFVG